MTDIVWEDPPRSTRGTRVVPAEVVAFVAALREHEGKWARWPLPLKSRGGASSLAQAIRNERRGGFVLNGHDEGGWEARSVVVNDQPRVYVRWVES